MNRHGFNGLCRYNLKGKYNVPFGRYVKPYFPLFEMRYFHQKSQNTTFINKDFTETFSIAKQGDLIYCDPPYAPIVQTSNFTSYTHKKFSMAEQYLLADLARCSAKRGISVLISNHDTEEMRRIYQGSEIISYPVQRTINCNGKERRPVQELLAIFHSD